MVIPVMLMEVAVTSASRHLLSRAAIRIPEDGKMDPRHRGFILALGGYRIVCIQRSLPRARYIQLE